MSEPAVTPPPVSPVLQQALICAAIQTYKAYIAGGAFPGDDPMKFIGNPKGWTYVEAFYGQDVFDKQPIHKLVLFGLVFRADDDGDRYLVAFRGHQGDPRVDRRRRCPQDRLRALPVRKRSGRPVRRARRGWILEDLRLLAHRPLRHARRIGADQPGRHRPQPRLVPGDALYPRRHAQSPVVAIDELQTSPVPARETARLPTFTTRSRANMTTRRFGSSTRKTSCPACLRRLSATTTPVRPRTSASSPRRASYRATACDTRRTTTRAPWPTSSAPRSTASWKGAPQCR